MTDVERLILENPALVLTLWINVGQSLRERREPLTFVVSDEVLAPV